MSGLSPMGGGPVGGGPVGGGSVDGGEFAPARFSIQDRQRLEESAEAFEAIFLKQMLTSMRRTVPKGVDGKGGLIRESEGEKIFRDLLDGEYAQIMSRQGRGLGLKAYLLQSAQNPAVARPSSVVGAESQPVGIKQLQAESDAFNALTSAPMGGMLGRE